jgi:hypothetical protein
VSTDSGAGRGAGLTACTPATRGIAGLSAARTISTVTANIPKACGFDVSGTFGGAAFADGWPIIGKATFGALGTEHFVSGFQGVIISFYNTAGAEYTRLYGRSAALVRPMWSGFGVTSKAAIDRAGTTKWIRLPARLKAGTYNYAPLGAATLAADVARGSEWTGQSWHLDGATTVHGIRCTVLVSRPATAKSPWGPEWLYVDTATGLPVQIGYYYETTHSEHVTALFSDWGHAGSVTAPPASKVVAG